VGTFSLFFLSSSTSSLTGKGAGAEEEDDAGAGMYLPIVLATVGTAIFDEEEVSSIIFLPGALLASSCKDFKKTVDMNFTVENKRGNYTSTDSLVPVEATLSFQ
jgi:hypothetical protein